MASPRARLERDGTGRVAPRRHPVGARPLRDGHVLRGYAAGRASHVLPQYQGGIQPFARGGEAANAKPTQKVRPPGPTARAREETTAPRIGLHQLDGVESAADNSQVDHPGRLSHIKPGHLYSQGLATPEALFRAAREVGFGVVVAEYRQNALARMVSSFEMRKRTPADAKAVFCKRDGELVKKLEWERTIWERGVAAAKAEEFTIIEFTFLELISSVCTCVERATSVLADCAGARCECRDQVKENVHMRTSHRDRTLAERTSPTAANCIRAALRVEPQYAWMLDLSRHEPPEGVSNANASWLVGSS